MTKIKMTKEGLEKLYLKLIQLEQEEKELEKAMTVACQNSNGDGAHDNAEFEYLFSLARRKTKEIADLKLQMRYNIEIVETVEMAEEFVNIGDTIDANFIFSEDDEEEMTIQLVGGTGNSTTNQVSINSPVGQAIYGKRIGETVFYEVNKNKIQVNLLRKVKTKGKSK